MSKPKLELQVNIPTTVTLLQTEPATGENNYGQWWLYNVECEGTEYSYFATEAVVKELQSNNVCEGDTVIITKKLIKKGKHNVPDFEVCVLENHEDLQSNINSNGSSGKINGSVNNKTSFVKNAYPNSNGENKKTLVKPDQSAVSNDYPVMLRCMTEAMLIRDELGGDVDVNKLGVTLFLRKVKP